MGKRTSIFSGILLLLFTAPSFAGLGISPSHIDVELKKPTYTYPISVTNTGDNPVHVKIYVSGFTQYLKGTVIFSQANPKYDGSPFVTVDTDGFVIPPHSSKIVNASIKRPEKRTGSLYAAVCAQTIPASGKQLGSSIRVIAGIRAVLPGPKIKSGKILAIELEQPKPEGEIKISTLFENTGNVHFRTGGKVEIQHAAGNIIDTIPIKEGGTYPPCQRYFYTKFTPEDLSPGKYKIKASILNATKTEEFRVIRKNEIEQIRASLTGFSPVEKQLTKDKPIEFQGLFSNLGNVKLSVHGWIRIEDAGGRKVAGIEIERQEVEPASTLPFKKVLRKGLPAGDYSAAARITYGENRVVQASTKFRVRETIPVAGLAISKFVIEYVAGQPCQILITVKNTGNLSLRPAGLVDIKDKRGGKVGSVGINEFGLEPGQSKAIKLNWKGKLLSGIYTGEVTLLFGNKSISKSTSFLAK